MPSVAPLVGPHARGEVQRRALNTRCSVWFIGSSSRPRLRRVIHSLTLAINPYIITPI